MSTYVLGAYSKDYPFITNRIRAAIYLQSDPQAFIAEQIDSTPGHPARTWMFPGLPLGNYGFTLDIIDASGIPSGNLAKFDVVPGDIEGTLNRKDEQIRVGSTPNFEADASQAIFDGSNGSPDYRGWSIVPSELTGRGILSVRADYTWDEVTGKLTLKQAGDVFSGGTDWNIHFNPKNAPTESVSTVTDFSMELWTASKAIETSSFGKKVLIELVGVYGEFTLPDINLVVRGRKLSVEVGGNNYCIRFLPFGSNKINFLRGNLFVLPNEKFSIYKFVRPDNTSEWRVCDESGFFSLCGTIVYEDSVLSNTFNKHYTNGAIESVSQYARIYNEVVLKLPPNQRVNFDDWIVGNNRYFFSLANSSNPLYAGKFHFPDRTMKYLRATIPGVFGKAGDYMANAIKTFNFDIPRESRPGRSDNANDRDVMIPGGNGTKISVNIPGSDETRPETVLNNQYILL